MNPYSVPIGVYMFVAVHALHVHVFGHHLVVSGFHVFVPHCVAVPPCQAGPLLFKGVCPRQPSAGLFHHAVCQPEFGATNTATPGSREG